MFSYELDFVTLSGTDFIAGNTVFLFFMNNGPAHAVCKFMAGFALHGNVGLILFIMVYLLCGRYSV